MRIPEFVRRRSGWLAAIAAGFLAACVVVEDGPRPPPGPGPGPGGICTREYAPVCGERGRQQQTFGNACEARSEGFRIAHQGECRRGPDRPGRPGRPGPGGPVMCTQQYDPVCAARGNREQTFGNQCTAEAQGFRVVHRGECRAGGRPGGPGAGRPQACTREYRPVCAIRGNRQQTFGNACEAESAGWRIRRQGEC